MGLRVNVYPNPLGDCTNNGISSRGNALTIVNIKGPFGPTPEAPAAYLVANSRAPLAPIIVPVDADGQPDQRRTMNGGNFAYGDDRFGEAVAAIMGIRVSVAVPIFDRIE